ncbi:unnamed protein product [Adineta ricciae]|uniref:EGF-like domain-containing protein n=1 Tax=Adineta ricciae TaxID=249248 RepID=A0A815T5X2_ADIRI|nr:unnamed protein product [Adineta ricciae]CAF1503463.1 unnamed protein product [Adineta ricciae]
MSNLFFIIILLSISQIETISYPISYNLPRFCQNISWELNPENFPDNNYSSGHVNSLFIDTNDTVYASIRSFANIYAWLKTKVRLQTNSFSSSDEPYSLFVTNTNEIYVDLTNNYRIEKTKLNSSNKTNVMNNSGPCAGLFIDINNTFYCSITQSHKVLRKSLNNYSSSTEIAVENRSSLNGLNGPCGIFVTVNFRLYVTECGNHRIQYFEWKSTNGTIIRASTGLSNVPLNCPTGIIIDADENLFIIDNEGFRIIQFRFGEFTCIIGCSRAVNRITTLPIFPETLSFDSYGNIYVADRNGDARILKYNLRTNSCYESTTTNSLDISTSTMFESTSIISTSNEGNITFLTTSSFNRISSPSVFLPSVCPNSTLIGIHCNISLTLCDLCQNNSTCQTINGMFYCNCLSGFNGTQCQFDYRPCILNRCWNNGICNQLTNITFHCSCQLNWTGIYCEKMINFCENVTCENEGVCRSLLGDYQCECLSESYSGRHCEIKETKLIVVQMVSKSFAVIAILGMSSIVAFIFIMDIMKYCFGINPIRGELERIRRKKSRKKFKARVIQKFVYKDKTFTSQV